MFTGKINSDFFTGPWRWAVAVTLLAVLLYLPILSNGFVFDDHGLIEQNTAIRDISNVPSFFSQDLWAFYYADEYQKRIHYWRPILLGSWALTYQLSGSNPLGYHLLSILLHGLCTFLVFVVGREVMGRERTAAIAAAIFAFHPVHIDAVAWASGLSDLLVTAFALAALISYHRFRNRETPAALPWGIAAAVFLVLAALSKENGVMVFGILVFYEILLAPRKRKTHSYVFLGVFFVLMTGYFVLRHQIMGPPDTKLFAVPFGQLINTLTAVSGNYARLLLFPLQLKATYPVRVYENFLHPDILIAVLFLVLLGALLAVTLRSKKDFFWLFFLGLPLLPAINIIGFGTDLLNERYLYLPSVGFCFLLAVFFTGRLTALWRFWSPKRITILIVILLCAYGLRDFLRFPDWRDEFTYLTVTLRDAPRAHIHHNNMGKYLYKKRHDPAGAERSFLEAIELAPGFEYAKANLATLYLERGRLPEALRFASEAAAIAPNWAGPLITAGEAAGRMGRMEQSEEFLLKALVFSLPNYC
ncbi:MAG: phospholipid carrier-dependent glycosyltransferase [bacterium]|nr:phospholipid carrier-dependent glycosyltransferase [bacterium]